MGLKTHWVFHMTKSTFKKSYFVPVCIADTQCNLKIWKRDITDLYKTQVSYMRELRRILDLLRLVCTQCPYENLYSLL